MWIWFYSYNLLLIVKVKVARMKITSKIVDILHNFLFYTLYQIEHVMLIQSKFERWKIFTSKAKLMFTNIVKKIEDMTDSFSFIIWKVKKKNISIVSELDMSLE